MILNSLQIAGAGAAACFERLTGCGRGRLALTGPDRGDIFLGRAVGGLDEAKLARLPLVVVSFGSEQEGAISGVISERGLARRSEMYDRTALERALAESNRSPRIAVSLPLFSCPARAACGFGACDHRPASTGKSAGANPFDCDLRATLHHDARRGPVPVERARPAPPYFEQWSRPLARRKHEAQDCQTTWRVRLMRDNTARNQR